MTATDNTPSLLIYYENETRAQQIAAMVAERFPQLSPRVATTPDAAAGAVADAEIIVGWGLPVKLLREATRLRWFHKLGAGVDDLIMVDGLPSDVTLTRTDGKVFGARMAEYTIAYVLAHTQNVRRILQQQAAGKWEPFITDTIAGKTIGVAGVGDIGSEVVRKAAALDMNVVGWRRSAVDVEGVSRTYVGEDEFHDFLGVCDFIVIVLPLTPATRGLFDADAFAAMRDGAHLVNIGRGPIVVEEHMIAALQSGKLSGATLDVFDEEPLPPNNPLWTMPNVTITPHMSGPSVAAAVAAPFLANLERYLAGERLHKVVARNTGY